MSKIYEAVRKTGGGALELARLLPGDPPPLDLGREPIAEEIAKPADLSGQNGSYDSGSLVKQQPSFRSARVSLAKGVPLLPFDDPSSAAADQYKIVRTKIVQHSLTPRVVLISSAERGDGKSVSAVNIAGALAVSPDTSALLIDGDFRGANLAVSLGLTASPGLADVLTGECDINDAIVRLEPLSNLYLMPTGNIHAHSAELFASPLWRNACEFMRRQFTYTVIDSPPVGAVADYDLLQALCDGVILVVRPDHTRRALCMKAIKTVPKDKLIGVLLNGIEDSFFGRGAGHYYGY